MEKKSELHRPVKKVITDQTNNKRYIIHYRDSNYYKGLGMRAKRTHNVGWFKQNPWLAKLIKYNTE